MAVSRSALDYMERRGLAYTRRYPSPRQDFILDRVREIPTALRAAHLVTDVDGSPPPDRGKADPFPPPQEVSG